MDMRFDGCSGADGPVGKGWFRKYKGNTTIWMDLLGRVGPESAKLILPHTYTTLFCISQCITQ